MINVYTNIQVVEVDMTDIADVNQCDFLQIIHTTSVGFNRARGRPRVIALPKGTTLTNAQVYTKALSAVESLGVEGASPPAIVLLDSYGRCSVHSSDYNSTCRGCPLANDDEPFTCATDYYGDLNCSLGVSWGNAGDDYDVARDEEVRKVVQPSSTDEGTNSNYTNNPNKYLFYL